MLQVLLVVVVVETYSAMFSASQQFSTGRVLLLAVYYRYVDKNDNQHRQSGKRSIVLYLEMRKVYHTYYSVME